MWDTDSIYPFSRLAQPNNIIRFAHSDGSTGYIAELAIPFLPFILH